MHYHILILSIFLAVSCNEEKQIVQSSQNGGDQLIGFGEGTPEQEGLGGVGDPSPTGEVTVTQIPSGETPPSQEIPPEDQQVNYDNVDLNTVVYSKSHINVPGVCESESFNSITTILFRNAPSRVVVSTTLEFMKAYRDEAIIILANDIDLAGLKTLPTAKIPQLLIFGNNHTIKNYDSNRPLFLDTTSAFFCHLKIDQIKVHASENSSDISMGGLFHRSRMYS